MNVHNKFSLAGIIEKHTALSSIKHKLPVTSDLEITKAPRIEYERKFPGPAGLIPKKVCINFPHSYKYET